MGSSGPGNGGTAMAPSGLWHNSASRVAGSVLRPYSYAWTSSSEDASAAGIQQGQHDQVAAVTLDEPSSDGSGHTDRRPGLPTQSDAAVEPLLGPARDPRHRRDPDRAATASRSGSDSPAPVHPNVAGDFPRHRRHRPPRLHLDRKHNRRCANSREMTSRCSSDRRALAPDGPDQPHTTRLCQPVLPRRPRHPGGSRCLLQRRP